MAELANGPFWEGLDRINRAGSVEVLRGALMDALAHIGFHGAYFLAPVVADPEIGRTLVNVGFDAEWERLYREEFYRVDPLPQIGMTRQSAFRWPEDIDLEVLTPEQRAYLERLDDFGMAHGLAVACFGPFARCGFVGIDRADFKGEIDRERRLMAETCARVSFRRYVRLAQPFTDEVPKLSGRETQVLHLLADGKSNPVIAQLLEISPSSVDVYVQRLFGKLGVADRTTASVRALSMGLIVTGAYPEKN